MRINPILIVLLTLLTFFGSGCGRKEEVGDGEYKIYYLERNENHLNTIFYETETPKEERELLVEELLMQLKTQRKEIEYKPVIQGFVVKDCIFMPVRLL